MTTAQADCIPAQAFVKKIISWYSQNGRQNLPWRRQITPYHIWVSEIMLQQTQVATVIPYYQRFINTFADLNSLANAELETVLHLWSGLGYYARARNLHKAANIIKAKHQGHFPTAFADIIALPGIGRSTAGAILSIAHQKPYPILDGNVKRVLARIYAIDEWPGKAHIESKLWNYATRLTPKDDVADYTQAIMDLGATVCTRRQPDCQHCPVHRYCRAFATGDASVYPKPRPKKERPVHQIRMWLIENPQGKFLLEKRPPTGIWGGLWSLPEQATTETMQDWLQPLGLNDLSCTQLPQIQHSFSHYHLQIQPIYLKTGKLESKVMAANRWFWYKPGVSMGGLAAPVSKLLATVASKGLATVSEHTL